MRPLLSNALFREVRPEFFRVLAGQKTGRLYIDVLDTLERVTAQRVRGVERDDALAMVEEVVEADAEVPLDEADPTSAALSTREKARAVLDVLHRTGWLEEEERPDWQKLVHFQPAGQTLMQTLRKIAFPEGVIFSDKLVLAILRSACAEEESRLAELEKLIPKRTADLDALKNTIRESPGDVSLYLELKTRIREFVGEINRMKETGRTLESALTARVNGAREWLKELSALPLNLEAGTVQAVEHAITAVEHAGVQEFATTSRALSEAAQRAAAEVSRLVEPTQRQLAKIRSELGPLREQIGALRIGKLPFPTRLLDALNQHLLSSPGDLAARHLRELCEVKDGEEHWRPAIEVAFTRKFAVVVAPEQYDEAEKIYHQLREETRGESLVNPTKALRIAKPIRNGSLAEKLTTQHPVAEAIISHQFG
ncbi:MAG: Wadjet anti-phage system protein JetA family protein, partial [Terrimicrobiaceae bacterium]